jgi:hypothetical protein
MSNFPTTSYRETQPVVPDSDEDHQVGNQHIEEASSAASPQPHSSPSPTGVQFSDKYPDNQYSDPQALTSDATLQDIAPNFLSTSAQFNVSPQFLDYNPLRPEPTITLSKQQLHTIPAPPTSKVFRSQVHTSNPILPNQLDTQTTQ